MYHKSASSTKCNQTTTVKNASKKSKPRRYGQALKFHNFVANNSSSSAGDNWQKSRQTTHCLKEEHGSKQITVSHWQSDEQKVAHSEDDANSSRRVTRKRSSPSLMEEDKCWTTIADGLVVKRPKPHQIQTTNETSPRTPPTSENEPKNLFIDILNGLENVASPTDQSGGGREQLEKPLEVVAGQTPQPPAHRRRKSAIVRRFISSQDHPLDIRWSTSAEEKQQQFQDEPLDLSVKKPSSCFLQLRQIPPKLSGSDQSERNLVHATTTTVSEKQIAIAHHQPNCSSSTDDVLFPDYLRTAMSSTLDEMKAYRGKQGRRTETDSVGERDAIKQRLEQTFQKNGFLIKTKEVTDGEATFCKFRQLTKYTRYYFKALHQHLPEEVNKLWKGFLPPKSGGSRSPGSGTNS